MSKITNGNERKRNIVQNLLQKITLYNSNFALFRQEEAIDSYSLDIIRTESRKNGIKIIFIPNRILKIALEKQQFSDDNFNKLLKYNNFIVLSKDAIKAVNLPEYIKDKKLKNKVQIKAIVFKNTAIYDSKTIQLLIRSGTEKGLKIIIVKIIRRPLVRILRMLDVYQKHNNS